MKKFNVKEIPQKVWKALAVKEKEILLALFRKFGYLRYSASTEGYTVYSHHFELFSDMEDGMFVGLPIHSRPRTDEDTFLQALKSFLAHIISGETNHGCIYLRTENKSPVLLQDLTGEKFFKMSIQDFSFSKVDLETAKKIYESMKKRDRIITDHIIHNTPSF